MVLQLKALGVENVLRGFDFMTGPPSGMMARALEFLSALKAVSRSSACGVEKRRSEP
jgi:ATP-dependent RNA helicase DDX35